MFKNMSYIVWLINKKKKTITASSISVFFPGAYAIGRFLHSVSLRFTIDHVSRVPHCPAAFGSCAKDQSFQDADGRQQDRLEGGAPLTRAGQRSARAPGADDAALRPLRFVLPNAAPAGVQR